MSFQCPGKILLVEDNPSDELLTIRAFSKNNITNEVVVVRDGAEAVDYLFGIGSYAGRDTSDIPVLILLDLKLPKLNGFQVLERIRSDSVIGLTPVVILTASKEDEDVIKGYGLGANSYIRKPVDFNEFMEAVKQLGIYWLMINCPLPRK